MQYSEHAERVPYDFAAHRSEIVQCDARAATGTSGGTRARTDAGSEDSTRAAITSVEPAGRIVTRGGGETDPLERTGYAALIAGLD